MNKKKLVLSVLSTAVISSMATSAFAMPGGVYIGNNVYKHYSLLSFASPTNIGKAVKEMNDVGFENVVYVSEDGQAVNLQDFINSGATDLNKALHKATDADFRDSAKHKFESIDEDGAVLKDPIVPFPGPTVDIDKIKLEYDGDLVLTVGSEDNGELELWAQAYKGDKEVEDDIDFEWYTSNPKVATVEDGIVTAVGEGEVEIWASYGDVKSDKVKIKVNPATSAELKVEKVSAITTKSFKVEFNKAIDAEKAKFSIKKDNVTLNVSEVKVSDDKKSATLTLSTKLTKGDYAVTVSGLTTEAITKTVAVEDEKLAKVEVNDVAVLKDYKPDSGVSKFAVSFKAFNQYDEDVTKTDLNNLQWNYSLGVTEVAKETDKAKGLITLTGKLKSGDKFKITAVDTTNGLVIQKDVTIGDMGTVAEVSNITLYNEDKKQIDTSNVDQFALVFDAKDQYGNSITATQFKEEMIVTPSNGLVVKVKDVEAGKGDNDGKLVIPFDKPTPTNIAGNATIRMISKVTGKTFTYDLTVKEVAALDTFNLSAPQVLVAAGETVEIPFTAADQYGNAITTFAELNGKVTFTTPGEDASAKFENDYVNKKAVLKYTAPKTAGKYLVAASTPSGKQSTIFVDVKAAASPTVVSKAKDLTNTLAIGASVKVAAKNFEVADTYGRAVKLDAKFFGNYYLKLEATDGNADVVTINGDKDPVNITDANTSVELKAAKKGSEQFKVTLYNKKDDTKVNGSELEFKIASVEGTDVVKYEVSDLSTIYDGGGDYSVDFAVVGKKQDNTSVAVPKEKVTVVSSAAGLTYNKDTGKLTADHVIAGTEEKDVVVTLTIIIDTQDGPVQFTKDVTVTNKAPKLVSIKTESTEDIEVNGGVATAASDVTAAQLVAVFEGTDNYGGPVIFSTGTNIADGVYVTFTGAKDANPPSKGGKELKLTNGNGTVAKIEGAEAGDSFSITVVKEGKSATLKVVINKDVTPAPTEVVLDTDSAGTAGDKEITGLTSGKTYKVTVGTGASATVKYVKADGTLSADKTDAAPLTGTKIIGLTNGTTYKVEEMAP